MTLDKTPPWKIGLAQAVCVLCYVLFFALSVQTIHGWLGDIFPNPFVGIPFFLTAFVFSALACGGAILGYPLVLLFEKNVRRAVHIICWSAVWLAVFLATALVTAIGISL